MVPRANSQRQWVTAQPGLGNYLDLSQLCLCSILVLLSTPLYGWTPPLHVLTKRLPKVSTSEPLDSPLPTAFDSMQMACTHSLPLIQNENENNAFVEEMSSWDGAIYGLPTPTSVITTTTIIISVIKKLTLYHCKRLMVLKHHNNSHDGRYFGIPTS